MGIFDWSGNTLLIAEDDHFSFLYLREILSVTKVNIVYADNGMRAFSECLKNPAISVVLMDIKMPVVNGLESTRLIKKYKSNITVIAQTAFAMADDRVRCISAGCDDYITKPVNAELLIEKLSKIFAQPLKSEHFSNHQSSDLKISNIPNSIS